jgi:hypothetical protein
LQPVLFHELEVAPNTKGYQAGFSFLRAPEEARQLFFQKIKSPACFAAAIGVKSFLHRTKV